MSRKDGTTAQVRALLTASGALSIRALMDALPSTTDRAYLTTLIKWMRNRGEVRTFVLSGEPVHELDPSFTGAKKERPAKSSPVPSGPSAHSGPQQAAGESAAPESLSAPPATPDATPQADGATEAPSPEAVTHAGEVRLANEASWYGIVGLAEKIKAQIKEAAADTGAQATPVDAPFGLRDRVDAIARDLEDALGDGIDAGIHTAALKSIAVASGAINRALVALHQHSHQQGATS